MSTVEAAELIGCVDSRVRQLLRAKILEGEQIGRTWIVRKISAQAYRDSERKPGPKPEGRLIGKKTPSKRKK